VFTSEFPVGERLASFKGDDIGKQVGTTNFFSSKLACIVNIVTMTL